MKLTLKDQYYNMREMVEPHPQVIAKAEQAMRMAGVEPLVKPIRGGTDGSRLSYMGLPLSEPVHGRYELPRQIRVCIARHDEESYADHHQPGRPLGRIGWPCGGCGTAGMYDLFTNQ